jgi:predicted Zn-dependent protease
MARVNRAMALIELDRYNEAEELLANVIAANPKNMRAVYQQARVFLKRGQLDKAEGNILQVLAAYPRDRISWQQLGELYKIKRDLQMRAMLTSRFWRLTRRTQARTTT